MRCPRCHRESAEGSVFCQSCGAPLTLRPEPTAPNLDATIDLDRRGPPGPPPLPGIPGRAAQPPAQPLKPASLARPRGAAPPPAEPIRSPPRAHPPAPLPAPAQAPAAVAPRPAAARPPAPAPSIPPAAPAPAAPALEPVAPPVEERSHWDLRLAQMPRERKPELALEPLPATKVMPRAPAAPPEPDPATAPARTSSPQRSDATVEVDVGPMEIRLRRAPDGKRLASWVLDGIPFLLAFAAALRFALDSLPKSAPLDLLGYLDLAGREAQGITGPIFAGTLVLFGAYHALAHGLGGATLGKRLVGIRVVRRDGRIPGLGQATLRAVLACLSLALLGLGVLLALFTRSGRALHDLLSRTWVVDAP